MTTLLVVVAVGCAVVLVGHFGRQVWGRTRTMQRHQHALDTLAGLTQRGEVEGLDGGTEHQAHVRVVGSSTQLGDAGHPQLPPPRAFSGPGPGRPSPFRRPSHMPPSVVAMEAAATADQLERDPSTRLVRSATPPPQLRPPVRRPVGEHAGPTVTHAYPDPIPSEGAGDAGEPATRPLPVVQPQVYYFDDFGPNTQAPEPSSPRWSWARRGSQSPAPQHGRQPDKEVETAREEDRTRPIELPVPKPPKGAPASTRGGGRKATAARVLSLAAVVAGLVAIGVTLAETLPSGPKSGTPLAVTKPTSTRSVPPRRVVTTTVPTTLPPPKPAVLLGASQGNVTYQLHSATASIVVRATGRCWVEVRVGSHAGTIVTEETLIAGQSARVTGPAWVRLGNPPAVAVMVDGTTITVPGATQAVPVNLRFTLG
jgi:hypothetical protein